jgi:hypothetical protein
MARLLERFRAGQPRFESLTSDRPGCLIEFVDSRPPRTDSSKISGDRLVVSRTGPTLWSRGLSIALFWAIGMTLGARPAHSAGCHAPERPTLGLSFSWELERPPAPTIDRHDSPAPRYVPIPCSGETPGTTVRDGSAHPVAALFVARFEPAPTCFRLVSAPSSLRLQFRHSRLDRPPRHRASSV